MSNGTSHLLERRSTVATRYSTLQLDTRYKRRPARPATKWASSHQSEKDDRAQRSLRMRSGFALVRSKSGNTASACALRATTLYVLCHASLFSANRHSTQGLQLPGLSLTIHHRYAVRTTQRPDAACTASQVSRTRRPPTVNAHSQWNEKGT